MLFCQGLMFNVMLVRREAETLILLHAFNKKALRLKDPSNVLIKESTCLAMHWHTAKSDIISPRQSNTQRVSSSPANTV